MNPNMTKNETDLLSTQDDASDIFVDKNAITTVDGVVQVI